ncbi:MAG: hypothetical protein ACM3W4_01705 [Ignavibacteriales bacterium]
MTRDLEDDLWDLADAVRPKRWKPFVSRLTDTFAVFDNDDHEVLPWPAFDGSHTANTRGKREALCRFIAAANPSAIKKLIAENRRLRAQARTEDGHG